MKNSNTRLGVLIVLTILSAVFFVLTIIPNSPFIKTNICMENEKAEQMYKSKNETAKNNFIEKRNEDCKTLLKYAKEPKTTFEKIDTCNMVDSVVDASNHYIELHVKNKHLVKDELKYLAKNVKKYNYCPQYNSVVEEINKAAMVNK